MMNKFPVRRSNRLKDYDYSQNGAYFITVCVKDCAKSLCEIFVEANGVRPRLSEIGQAVESEIVRLSDVYDTVRVDCFVIMPNHVHMILMIGGETCHGRTQFAPTVSRVIKQWKGAITKQIGFPLWQRSFHDHIIRDERDYNRIAEYIANNPQTWRRDCFYEGTADK